MEDYSLTILGCSSATPNSQRFPSAQVLHFLGKYFLLDCGEGAQIQMRRVKVPFDNLSAIFISHLHGDHYFGIFGLLASMCLLGRKNHLKIYAPEGLEELIRFQFRDQELTYTIEFIPLPKEPFTCIYKTDSYEIHSIYLSHRIDCWGFYFVEKEKARKIKKEAIAQYGLGIEDIKNIKNGANLVLNETTVIPNHELTKDPPRPFSYAFIADTAYKSQIARYINNVRLMYHEATFLENFSDLAVQTFHSTAKQAAECAKLAHAEKLIIGHYSARYKSLEGHLLEATEVFENTELASDLYTHTLHKKPYCLWKSNDVTE